MDIPVQEILNYGAYALFAFLYVYTINYMNKKNDEREKRYLDTIDKFTVSIDKLADSIDKQNDNKGGK